jgi:hypothetical protein
MSVQPHSQNALLQTIGSAGISKFNNFDEYILYLVHAVKIDFIDKSSKSKYNNEESRHFQESGIWR